MAKYRNRRPTIFEDDNQTRIPVSEQLDSADIVGRTSKEVMKLREIGPDGTEYNSDIELKLGETITDIPGEFNVPTSSVFDNTQFGTVPFPVTTETLSVSMRVKLDSTDLTHQIFMTDGDNYANTFQLYYDNVGSTGYKLWHKYSGVEINVPLAIDNEYHHFVCVYDGSAGAPYIELFIDSISQGTAVVTAPQALAISETFSLGTDDTGFPIAGQTTYRLKGNIEHMELWNGLLDSADAAALFNAGASRYPETIIDKPLLANYLMGDNKQDTTALVKDNKGTADIAYSGTVTFDTVDVS